MWQLNTSGKMNGYKLKKYLAVQGLQIHGI